MKNKIDIIISGINEENKFSLEKIEKLIKENNLSQKEIEYVELKLRLLIKDLEAEKSRIVTAIFNHHTHANAHKNYNVKSLH